MADISADIPTAVNNALPASADQASFALVFGSNSTDNSTPPQTWISAVFVSISSPTVADVAPTPPPIVIQGGTIEGSSAFNTGMN